MEKTLIPRDEYAKIVDQMPILCIDCIVVHEGQYLLVKRKNEPLKGKYWLLGGRVFKGETLKEAVIRKMREEIGVAVRIIKLAGFHEYIYDKNEFDLDSVHTLSAVFYVSPLRTDIKLDGQSSDYKWSSSLPKDLNLMSYYE